jgi:aerobic carbon-monoxide dehydrogenase medium subunit
MRFRVMTPATLSEAVTILDALKDETHILAGGTDLLPKMKQGVTKPVHVLCLDKIAGLDHLSYIPGEGLHIGALVTHARVADHPVVRERYSALADACAAVGSPQIRNRGTVVGNIANASPAADTVPPLLTFGAKAVIRGPDGTKEIPLVEFFRGPGQTVLRYGQVIEGIHVPEPSPDTLSVYLKLGRRKALEISICSVALSAIPSAGLWHNIRLALGAVAPVPILDTATGERMEGQVWTTGLLQEAGRSAASTSSPIDDQRASAAYRRAMVGVLVQRSAQLLNSRRAGGETHA